MEIREIAGESSANQTYLHLALNDAVSAYHQTHETISHHPPLTEETATPELTSLHHTLELQRATTLILASCCVEALANLYLAHKTTPEQFAVLERVNFLEKWTVVPSFLVPNYSFPRDGELYHDLKRLRACRNGIIHLKEEVSREGSVMHPGSYPDPGSDEHLFVARCGSLPERLLAHLASFDKTDAVMQLAMVLATAPMMRVFRLAGERRNGPNSG